MGSACSASPPARPRTGPGQEKAPAALRRAGLPARLAAAGVRVADYGDLPVVRWRPDPHQRRPHDLQAVLDVLRKTSRRVGEILAAGRVPLVLGGECSVTAAVLAAFRDRGHRAGAALHGRRHGPVHPGHQPHREILNRLGEHGGVDWSRVSVDTMSVRAKRGDHVGANPVDRGKPESKLHLVCDGGGLPCTAANVNDTTLFQPLLDDVPSVQGPSGRRRCRPAKVHGDKGYDSAANRAYLRRRRIKSRIARRGIESSSRLGRHRWRVERSLSWLSCFRRLGVCWDRDSGRWFAFVLLACAAVCFTRLSAQKEPVGSTVRSWSD